MNAKLIDGHHRTPEDSVNEGRLASIEISGDKDFGRDVFDAGAELVHVDQSSPNAFVDQLGDRLFFEPSDQCGGGGRMSLRSNSGGH